MRIYIIILVLGFLACDRKSELDNRIIVIASANLNLPADKVDFYVTIRETDYDLNKLYEKYKVKEKSIKETLKQLNIPNQKIRYSLLNIGKENWNLNNNPPNYATQDITFTIDSVSYYTKVQKILVESGFDNFSSEFVTDKIADYQDSVILIAIEKAKQKASLIAKGSNRKLSKILKVTDTNESDIQLSGGYVGHGAAASVKFLPPKGGDLTEIPQTIEISYSIKVTFELE